MAHETEKRPAHENLFSDYPDVLGRRDTDISSDILGQIQYLVYLHFIWFFGFIHPMKVSVGFDNYGLAMLEDSKSKLILLNGNQCWLPYKKVAWSSNPYGVHFLVSIHK